MRWMLGFLVVAACGDGEHAGPVDAPALDAVAADAVPIDATPIDATVIDGPPANIECRSNAECPADRYCDLATASYCDPFSISWCRPRPTSCPAPAPDAVPVCGCDGVQYPTSCDANAAGAVVGPGACAAPAGHFTCGGTYCELTTEYCAELRENTNHLRRFFECRPMPAHTGAVCPQLLEMPCAGQGLPVPDGGEFCNENAAAGTTHYMCTTIPN